MGRESGSDYGISGHGKALGHPPGATPEFQEPLSRLDTAILEQAINATKLSQVFATRTRIPKGLGRQSPLHLFECQPGKRLIVIDLILISLRLVFEPGREKAGGVIAPERMENFHDPC